MIITAAVAAAAAQTIHPAAEYVQLQLRYACATDNGEVAIGDLKVGDHVLAYDPKSGQTGSYAVDAVLVHTDPVIEDLTLDGETLQTTPEHPFFTQDRGFTAAGELTIGEHIRKADDSFGLVKALRFVAQA